MCKPLGCTHEFLLQSLDPDIDLTGCIFCKNKKLETELDDAKMCAMILIAGNNIKITKADIETWPWLEGK